MRILLVEDDEMIGIAIQDGLLRGGSGNLNNTYK